MGNICRSPAAEIVFRRMVETRGLADHFEIDSAGTLGHHQGSPPDARMSATLRERGYPIAGRARQVRCEDLEHFDLVLYMDADNRRELDRLARKQATPPRLECLADLCRRHRASEVPDPYYGGQAGFERVADLLEDACEALLERLAQPPAPPARDPG